MEGMRLPICPDLIDGVTIEIEPGATGGSKIWVGKDYSNPIHRDFFEVDKPYQGSLLGYICLLCFLGVWFSFVRGLFKKIAHPTLKPLEIKACRHQQSVSMCLVMMLTDHKNDQKTKANGYCFRNSTEDHSFRWCVMWQFIFRKFFEFAKY